MKRYETPEMEILAIGTEDIVTTSGGNGNTPPWQGGGGIEGPEI